MMTDSRSVEQAHVHQSKWVRFLPIVFFFFYLNFTVFLFAFGPWPYPVTDGTMLYTFLFFAHLALLIGYLSAAFRKPSGYSGLWKTKRLVVFVLIINLVMLVPTAVFRTGGLLPDISSAIESPGQAYSLLGFNQYKGVPVVEYLRMVFAPFIFMLFPLTVFYWARLKPVVRTLAAFCVLGMVAIYIAMGTNKGFVDLVILTPWLLLAGHLSGVSRLRWSRRFIIVTGGILLAVLALQFFIATQTTRIGSGASIGHFYPLGVYVDRDNFIVRNLPPKVQVGVWSLTSYITQGYYGLHLSLREPFIPMFGVGNSMFLFRQAARITDIDEIMDLSYPIRIRKYGWNPYVQWSSIYPWIASDVSFPGTILVVFLIGRLFALSWLDTLRGKNPFAVAMFTQLLIMLYYFSANNQCVQNGEGLFSFWGILLLWLYTRRRPVRKHFSNDVSHRLFS